MPLANDTVLQRFSSPVRQRQPGVCSVDRAGQKSCNSAKFFLHFPHSLTVPQKYLEICKNLQTLGHVVRNLGNSRQIWNYRGFAKFSNTLKLSVISVGNSLDYRETRDTSGNPKCIDKSEISPKTRSSRFPRKEIRLFESNCITRNQTMLYK